jgi:hypothetical protein
MVLTTKDASYIIVLGRVISVLPISSTIATGPREILAGVYNLFQAGCLWIGEINLIAECTVVVTSPIIHVIAGFVKHLPYIRAEGSLPLPKR